MRYTFRFTLGTVVLLAGLFLAACGPALETEEVSPLGSPPAATPVPTAAATPTSQVGGEGEDMVESARGALANLLGILPQNIQVVSVERVSWPDTSLGCPQEGQMYSQVVVLGQRIVLEAGGEQYSYHAGNGHVILCQDPRALPAATAETALDPKAEALVDKAKLDLRDRAGVAPGDIVVQSVEARMWRDSSLGCPQPGMQYLQVITPGYLIRLEVAGEVYEYHTNQENVVYCENPPAGEEGDVDAVAKLIAAARANLASVTGVAESAIEVIETQFVEWRDSSLGCPKAGQMYLQVITPGYLIRLRAGGQQYEYHTSMTQVMLCRP